LTIGLPPDTKVPQRAWQELQDRLVNVPYLNWWYRPEWAPRPQDPTQFQARIAVHDEQHLQDFVVLLREWGYQANIINR
jgi:hypothetical protein